MNESNLLLELVLKGQFGPGKEFFTSSSAGTMKVSLPEMLRAGYPQLATAVLSGDKLDGFYFPDAYEAGEYALEQKEEDVAWAIFSKLHPYRDFNGHSLVSYAIKCGCNKFLSNYLEKVSDVRSDRTLYHIEEKGPAKSTLLECAVIYKNLEAVKMLANATTPCEHPQFLYTDKNGRNALGVAAIMAVADRENQIFLEVLLDAMSEWYQPKRMEAIRWTNSQLLSYCQYGEKQDENDFFRKESGLAEETYAKADYERVRHLVSSFFDEMDARIASQFKFDMERRQAREREERKRRDAEREAKWMAEMKEAAELERAAAMFDIGGSPYSLP